MNMWGSGSNTISGTSGPKNDSARPGQTSSDCSDDEISLTNSREDGFGVPHLLGVLQYRGKRALRIMVWPHTVKLCSWATMGRCESAHSSSSAPFFTSCPWRNLLSFRLVYIGNLRFPRKNYFLFWMVESLNGDRVKSRSSSYVDHLPVPTWSWTRGLITNQANHTNDPVGPHVREANRMMILLPLVSMVRGCTHLSVSRESLLFT